MASIAAAVTTSSTSTAIATATGPSNPGSRPVIP